MASKSSIVDSFATQLKRLEEQHYGHAPAGMTLMQVELSLAAAKDAGRDTTSRLEQCVVGAWWFFNAWKDFNTALMDPEGSQDSGSVPDRAPDGG